MQPSDKGCYSAKSCLRTINLLIESQCNWQYDLHTIVQRIRWTNWCYPRRGSRSASSLFDKAPTSYGFRAMFVSLSMSSIFSMMNALSRDNLIHGLLHPCSLFHGLCACLEWLFSTKSSQETYYPIVQTGIETCATIAAVWCLLLLLFQLGLVFFRRIPHSRLGFNEGFQDALSQQ